MITMKTSHLPVGLDEVGIEGREKTSHLPVGLDEVGNEGHEKTSHLPVGLDEVGKEGQDHDHVAHCQLEFLILLFVAKPWEQKHTERMKEQTCTHISWIKTEKTKQHTHVHT